MVKLNNAIATNKLPRVARPDGQRARQIILDTAADLASVEGLDAISIGRLARKVNMSKSGLFAHFGSKEALQLAIIEAARDRYFKNVLIPVLETPEGLSRIRALLEATMRYLRSGLFPGGCFFVNVRAEFSARRDLIHEEIEKNKAWITHLLTENIRIAQSLGELNSDEDPEQLAFEIEALWDAPNWTLHSKRGKSDIRRAQLAVERRLASAGASPP